MTRWIHNLLRSIADTLAFDPDIDFRSREMPEMPSMYEITGECQRCGAVWRSRTAEAERHECVGLPKPGAYRWSQFFGSYIELIRYNDNETFWFMLVNHRAQGVAKNKSPFSALPLRRPGT